MAKSSLSVFKNFFSIFIAVVLHLGCFAFTATDPNQPTTSTKKRTVSPLSPSSPSRLKASSHKALSSSWSYLKRIFSSKPHKTCSQAAQSPVPTLASARSSQHSIVTMVLPQEEDQMSDTNRKKPPGSIQESDISTTNNHFFPLRNDIFPCTACGEIFQKPQLLEQHQAIKHAVSELVDGESGKNIVHIIFKTGWPWKEKNPEIHRVLKIHNSQKILSRFEEYRESVKAKAARNSVKRRDERCIADGNELLRFYCSTFMCDLGINGGSTLCNQQYCSICGIIKSGFSPKLDGISTLSSSWRAHVAVPEDIEQEFEFMNVKRAMLVCRVVAGRVGCEMEDVNKDDGGFDSVVGRGGNGVHSRLDEDELIVFNPRAVLPCFVIVYSV